MKRLRFRTLSLAPEIPVGEGADRRLAARWARLTRAMLGYGRAAALLAGIWLLGLVAFAAVFQFERTVDEARRAQVVLAEMRNQQGDVISVAFAAATGVGGAGATLAETKARLRSAQKPVDASVLELAAIGRSDAPAKIALLTTRFYAFADRLSVLVANGESTAAALAFGKAQRPGGIQGQMSAELTAADLHYGREASRARSVATFGSLLAILFLLTAFSVAFQRSVRARRRSDDVSMTDALTDLGNRRKLFNDMGRTTRSLTAGQTVTLGIFDLDGFKAYNDMFGHPAGDALLTRLGHRLAAAIGENGSAYRIGGDEFVITTSSPSAARLLKAAQAALSEHGKGFRIGCSIGSTRMAAGVTLEQALHVADQNLYANKRTQRSDARTEVKDVLLQVLAEQSGDLVTHVSHVAELVWSTATKLGLPDDVVDRARLAAELHDVGKSAIPDSILNKPGPLDPQERRYMQRHSQIGERIVGAAPALRDVAPIVRSTHERMDGAGYPDGLTGELIPICSRIIAVVDAYDAMTSDRTYQQAMSSEDALAELRNESGMQFDPDVVETFIAVLAGSPRDQVGDPALVAPAPGAQPTQPTHRDPLRAHATRRSRSPAERARTRSGRSPADPGRAQLGLDEYHERLREERRRAPWPRPRPRSPSRPSSRPCPPRPSAPRLGWGSPGR